MSQSERSPKSQCDIIMKGGITSGIVYPEVIMQLKDRYRFRSIGGTSAGAIAAAITAAAEYGRDSKTGGFRVVGGIPGDMAENLSSLFQPAPQAKLMHSVVVRGLLKERYVKAVLLLLEGEWVFTAAAAAVGLALCMLVLWLTTPLGVWPALLLTSLALLLALLLVLGTTVWRAIMLVAKAPKLLAQLDFGMCPGPTQPGYGKKLGLSDWLSLTIERAAGRIGPDTDQPPASPLTFGDLADAWREGDVHGRKEEAIELRMVTTNLSMRRPHTLPNLTENDTNYYWAEDEFRRLFPGWIVKWMIDTADPSQVIEMPDPRVPGAGGRRIKVYPFPEGRKLPVLVATRMSLSFPILISAVPLYRLDLIGSGGLPASNPSTGEQTPLRRILFSDGGLTSNFPIHFFDSLIPRRPTFGISLESYDSQLPSRRIQLPMHQTAGQWLAIDRIDGLREFVWSLLNSAKDWQDRLQGILPGYRERVVQVFLDGSEGGLNLDMPPPTIKKVADYGKRAGGLLLLDPAGPPPTGPDKDPFDFDDHRWRRFLIAFARLEEALETCFGRWGDTDPREFADFINAYKDNPRSYQRSSQLWRSEVFDRFDAIMTLVRGWNRSSLRDRKDADIPQPDTSIRITPKF